MPAKHRNLATSAGDLVDQQRRRDGRERELTLCNGSMLDVIPAKAGTHLTAGAEG